VGRQENLRTAFPSGLSSPPGVDLDLATLTGRVGFEHRPLGVLRGRIAAEYTGVDNTAITGQLVPDYQGDSFALMAHEDAHLGPSAEGDLDRVILSLGLRWDAQNLDMVPFPAWDLASSVTKRYSAVTGALGAVVRLAHDVALAGSLARGWRPPNAFELFARGEHGGVAAFQLGNPELVEESNVNGEIGLRYEGRRLRGRVSAFRSELSDYIYLADSGETEGGLPVFVHRQGDARIEGVEATAEAAPFSWMRVGLGYALADTWNKTTSRHLPQTSPDRLVASLSLERERLASLSRARLEISGAFVAKGTVSGPDEPLGTPTDAYAVFDLRGGFAVLLGGNEVALDGTVRNLFDADYTDFLWSYKPFAPNPGRDVRAVMTLRF
jgi:iron complex outermembrane receptor protein/hemoglobin/transferrin/lactoferrin receptor protein